MSYEKYIKYKTKYLNLKAEIHNQSLESNSDNSETNTDIINNFVDSNNLPNHLTESLHDLASEESNINLSNDEQIESQTNQSINIDLYGGKKLLRKEENNFSESDSDYNTTESSLLSFSSVESSNSDDTY